MLTRISAHRRGMATSRADGHLRSVDAPVCNSLHQQDGLNNLLFCTRPMHTAHTDHQSTCDDGSVLATWTSKSQPVVISAARSCAS